MKIKAGPGSRKNVLRLSLIGFAAGFVNGLLGAGGGIIIVFAMMPILSESGSSARDVFANALAVMLPVSFVSLISYFLSGRLVGERFGIYVLPAAIGGLVGAYILDKMNVSLLKKIFAAIVIWSGIYMITR